MSAAAGHAFLVLGNGATKRQDVMLVGVSFVKSEWNSAGKRHCDRTTT